MRFGLTGSHKHSYISLLSLGLLAVALVGSGCNSEDRGTVGGTGDTGGAVGNSGGTGAGTGSGGATASGGSTAGGATQSGGTSPGGTTSTGGALPAGCNEKTIDPGAFLACDTCTGGRCVPKDDFPGTPAEYFDACGPAGICLPDNMVETKGEIALAKCSSVLGNEGRCTSLCFPAARAQSAVLPQGSCGAEERCTPCFNPVNGTPTGACELGCDQGPTTQAILFTKCCGNRGYCVPRASIPGNAAKNLAPESCNGEGDPVCVPEAIVNNPAYRFSACHYSGAQSLLGEGRCVPSCIVDANPAGAALSKADCQDATDKCVPCNNPLTGAPSGACL
jgi:hypothetical protein